MQRRRLLSLFFPTLAALVAAFALAACGGGSSDSSAVSDLAGYIPPDAAVYVEGSLSPDEEVRANADGITKKLTGATLSEQLEKALASSDSDVDFETDVKPWLGDNAAVYVDGTAFRSGVIENSMAGSSGTAAFGEGDGETKYGAVVETSDKDAAQAFIEKQAKSGTTGEYQGVSYSAMKDDDGVAGIIDENFVAASDVTGFKAMVDAEKGDSLADDEGFEEVSGKIDDGSLVNVYVGNPAEASEAQGADYSGLYKAFGVDPDKAGAMFSLVPEEDEISIRGYTADQPDLTAGDASELIASFPANTVFAMGTGDLGKNATKIIDTLDKEGVPGMLKPGQLGQSLDQVSEQGVDVRSLIENLQEMGLFVQGDGPQRLGGALVLTSSDLDSVRSSFKTITGLIRLAGDNSVKPLGGGLTGLKVRTRQLPGRPVVFAVGTDRVVIAIGMPAAMQALKGDGADLGSDADFKTARDSIDGALAMYAKPQVIARFMAKSSGGDFQLAQAADILGKFRYMAAGSGDDEGSGELNLGLK